MMVPTYFDDLTGSPLSEAEVHCVTVRPPIAHGAVPVESPQYHFSAESLQLILNPAFVGVGEVLKLLREQRFVEGPTTFHTRVRNVEDDSGKGCRLQEITVTWELDMSNDHFESYKAHTQKLNVEGVELSANRSDSQISLVFSVPV